MHKLLAAYAQPDDIEAFDRHFREVHAPMMRRIPGLKKLVVNRITGSAAGGPPSLYLLVGLQFGPKEDYEAAMRSKESAAAVRDATEFCRAAGSSFEMLVAHEE